MNIYTRMVEILQQELTASGIPQEKAIESSVLAIDQIRGEVGGVNTYLPKNSPWKDRIARNAEIRKQFNGRNLVEVCRQHQVSRATVYRVCRR